MIPAHLRRIGARIHQIPGGLIAGDTGPITPGLAGGVDPQNGSARASCNDNFDADALFGRWGDAEYWLAVLGRVNRDTFHGER